MDGNASFLSENVMQDARTRSDCGTIVQEANVEIRQLLP